MYLLYCDETNFKKVPGDFFVYGGVAIDTEKAEDLSNELMGIRRRFGVPSDFLVKFNPGPDGMSHDSFIKFKQAIIGAAVKFDVKLLVNLLLHDIATSSDDARRHGINTLCYHFDCFLHRPKVAGLVLIDRFTDKQLDDQLREKLAVGLTGKLPYSSTMQIKFIIGYHIAAIGQSHFCSLVDVVIGSLRFAINAFTQGKREHEASAAAILQQLSPLFFREPDRSRNDNPVHVISLWFSPKEVKAKKYRDNYVSLRNYFQANGIAVAQNLDVADR
ncbi:DUF3800 domain-containing protein [Burkholderia stagnalis]|uniref:DUF3800 domain-containing protein n=1 Tax=Burkholderia stagnalis TaxID=1503054 RepID=UPI000F5CD0DE|nr:DUF3800 domain-containing protein [Burkholderia stagnalis]RQY10728.1 DUF3800 domain-containing protein [Burkholderia stagnalis]RQY88713.1 DUF3800 domain-containing protein [Burkholderia stagnalis]RQY96281.1 DUF3800 domain-containing protein [Burkholderia stagnalis]